MLELNGFPYNLVKFHIAMQDDHGNFTEMGYSYYRDWMDQFKEFEVMNNEFELRSVTYQNEPQLAII